ncbi:MAG: 2-(1,2-epoxy-1,2-dihydrophenyl)acetyl-CoA isomerase [Xanthomonadales bacterium]|nr:2-(1,2-epoxy-1,2-dihydrophenyl)acetyl-CoA isomerase [Xanthomonadales bacterium]
MSYETILFDVTDGVARITLNRPDRLNSFTVEMHTELRDALAKLAEDASVRVLLITGTGRGFCAGQDLSDRAVAPGGDAVDLGETVRTWWAPLVRTLRSLPLPVVSAVNGVAAGAGANVALAGDLVLAKQSASFIQPFCKLGLIPDTGGTWVLPRLVGTARAMGLAMLGDKLSADQAAGWGLIWKSIPDEQFDAEVEVLLAHLAKAPTKGLAQTKSLLYANGSAPLDEALEREADAMRQLGFSGDYREGVAAFMDKRTPTFTGQ